MSPLHRRGHGPLPPGARAAAGVAIVVALIVMVAARAVAFQPFDDGGAPPWTVSALAALANHGLLAAPASSLRTSRLTRVQAAALLARCLTRLSVILETPGRTVSRADLDAVRALLREYEAELAAIDVRVDVAQERVEELRARLSAARIGGDFRLRYEVSRTSLNNPGVGPVLPASSQALTPLATMRLRLYVEGDAGENVALRFRFTTFDVLGTTAGLWGGIPPTGHLNTDFFALNSAMFSPGWLSTAYAEWSHAFGLPLSVQLGSLGGDTWVPREGDPLTPLGLSSQHPSVLQFGPVGLLFSTGKDPAGERTLRTNLLDGLFLKYDREATEVRIVFADVEGLEGSYGSELFFGGRVQIGLTSDVLLGVNVVSDTCDGGGAVNNALLVAALSALGRGAGVGQCSFVWWGAQNGWLPSLNTGSTNPVTNVPGAGYGVDVTARLGPDVALQAEAAFWHDPTAQTTDLGWQVQAVVDRLLGPGSRLIVGYQSFGTGFYPPLGAAEDPVVGFIYPGGFDDGFLIVALPPVAGWTVSGGYEIGRSRGVGPQPAVVGFGGPSFSSAVCEQCSPAGQPFSAWLVSVERAIAQNTLLRFYYYHWEFNGAPQADIYRLEIGYRF